MANMLLMISYNRGAESEELALLTVKYQERYIGNETSSSVNSFFSKSPNRTASAKKRARRHPWGHSPGRRLSYLARRRHTFSCANLQQKASKAQPDKKKMILVERRKAQAVKKGKNSVTKTIGNGKTVKPVNTVNTKRALFQSPEDEKKNNRSIASDKSKTSPRGGSVQRLKRALWPDKADIDKENGAGLNFSSTGKRIAESLNSDSGSKKKCLRSLSFGENKTTCANNSIGDIPVLVPEDLSSLHRKKLLWAVSDALRNKGIGMEHSLFKLCVSELFRICKELWLKKFIHEEKSGSTSDRMLELANKFSGDIVKKAKIRLDMKRNSDNSISASSDKMNSSNSVKDCINDCPVIDKCNDLKAVPVESDIQSTSKIILNADKSLNKNVSKQLDKLSPVDIITECKTSSDKSLKDLGGERTEINCASTTDPNGFKNDIGICSYISSKEPPISVCNEASSVGVNSIHNDVKEENLSRCNIVYNNDFSPSLSSPSTPDEDRKLSTCNIDMNKIINSIHSDDECN